MKGKAEKNTQSKNNDAGITSAPAGKSVAHNWIETLLDITAFEVDRRGARPTIISRIFFVVTSAMYEAWAAYDKKAVGTVTRGTLRRPESKHTAYSNPEMSLKRVGD